MIASVKEETINVAEILQGSDFKSFGSFSSGGGRIKSTKMREICAVCTRFLVSWQIPPILLKINYLFMAGIQKAFLPVPGFLPTVLFSPNLTAGYGSKIAQFSIFPAKPLFSARLLDHY